MDSVENKNEEHKKIKIMLVDDDDMMRIYFRDIFWVHGFNDKYEIIIAPSIEEAEAKLNDESTRPQTIFLDVMIPVKGGKNDPSTLIKRCLDFITKMKNDPKLSNIKIIVYSGQKEKSIIDAVNKLGVEGYLVKGELMPKEIIAYTEKMHGANN